MLEVYVSDIHHPFEDVQAYGLFTKYLETTKPDILYLGGDIIDFAPISHYEKSPARLLDLQKDIDYTIDKLTNLRSLVPNARIYFQEGNHENRLTRYKWGKAPELDSLRCLTVPELLHFNGLEIEWVSSGTIKLIGKLNHIHGNEVGGGGINKAKSAYDKLSGNLIMGHWHVIQSYYHRMLNGDVYGSFVNPCLCSLIPEYILFPNWQQGFTNIHYSKSGAFHVDQNIIFPNSEGKGVSCLVDGKLNSFYKTPSRTKKGKAKWQI